jgi:hypothetical protein
VSSRLAAYWTITTAFLDEKLAILRIIRARIRRELAVSRLKRRRRRWR